MAEGLDIDAIVREVVARLAARTAAPPPSAPQPSAPTAAPSAPVSPLPAARRELPSEASLSEAVVSVGLLRDRVGAARRIRVAQRAVVTPAARDWLRARAIELVRDAPARDPGRSPVANGKVYVHATEANLRVAAWQTHIAAAGWELETLVPCPVRQATAELAAVLGPRNRLGILLTRDIVSAVCLANRRETVRAAAAHDLDATRLAVRQIHANLLVIDPGRAGPAAMKRIVQEYLRQGPREAPANWKEQS